MSEFDEPEEEEIGAQTVFLPVFYPYDANKALSEYEGFIWEDLDDYVMEMNDLAHQLMYTGFHVHIVFVSTRELEEWCEAVGLEPGDPMSWQSFAMERIEESHHFYDDIETLIYLDLTANAISFVYDKGDFSDEQMESASERAHMVRHEIEGGINQHATIEIRATMPKEYTESDVVQVEIEAVMDEDEREVVYLIDGSEELLEGIAILGELVTGQILVREELGGNTYVRGWTLGEGGIKSLSAAEVEELCCTIPGTSFRMDPEPGTQFINAVSV